MRWRSGGRYEVDPDGPGRAFSPLSMNAADVDNDGDLDVLGLTPTDPSWHVQSDMVAGRFWRNQGSLSFDVATEESGLEALNWTYYELAELWDADFPDTLELAEWACEQSDWQEACEDMAGGDYQMMLGGGSVFADFNNDGWLDLHVVDRHDCALDIIRNLVFLNQGDGTFRVLTTEESGMDATGVTADARDLDGDGRLDLVVAERVPVMGGDYPSYDRVYWNAGGFGGTSNHWVEIRFEGRPWSELVGAKVFLYDGDTLLGRRDLFPSTGTYKTSQDLFAHFGLGAHTDVAAVIQLYCPLQETSEIRIEDIAVDSRIAIDVDARSFRVLP